MQETWTTEPWSVRVARYQLHGGLIPLAYQMISDPAVKTREVLAMWMAHRPGIVYLYTKGVKEEIVAKSPDSVLCVDEAFIAKMIQSKIISKTDTSIDLIGSQHKRDGFVLYQAIHKDASPGPLSSSTSGSTPASSSSGPSSSQSAPITGSASNQASSGGNNLQSSQSASSNPIPSSTHSSNPNASSGGAGGTGGASTAATSSSSSSAASSLLFHLRVPYSNSASMLQLLHSGITTFPISTRDAAKIARDAHLLVPQPHQSSADGSSSNSARPGESGRQESQAASTSLLFPSSVPSSLYTSFSRPPHPSFVFTTPASTLPSTIPVVTPFASLDSRQSIPGVSSLSGVANASNNAGSSASSSVNSASNTQDSKMEGIVPSSQSLNPPSSVTSHSSATTASPNPSGTPRGSGGVTGGSSSSNNPTSLSSHATPSMTPSGPLTSISSTPSASGGIMAGQHLDPLPSLSAASLAPLVDLPYMPPSEEDMKSILDHLPMYLANAKPIQFLPHSQKLLEFPTPATPTLPASPHPYLTTDTQILRRRDRKLDDELDRYTVIYYLQLIFPPKSLARN